MTRRPFILAAAFALAATPALAAEDPIVARQLIMGANGGAAGVATGILKDEIAYSPVLGKSVLATLAAGAATVGDYFPEGSLDPARSKAAPKIWEDAAGFDKALADFASDAGAGLEAAGRDGPADKAAFAAAVQPVLENCKTCHEGFRVRDD
jgi:cytochrome c556